MRSAVGPHPLGPPLPSPPHRPGEGEAHPPNVFGLSRLLRAEVSSDGLFRAVVRQRGGDLLVLALGKILGGWGRPSPGGWGGDGRGVGGEVGRAGERSQEKDLWFSGWAGGGALSRYAGEGWGGGSPRNSPITPRYSSRFKIPVVCPEPSKTRTSAVG